MNSISSLLQRNPVRSIGLIDKKVVMPMVGLSVSQQDINRQTQTPLETKPWKQGLPISALFQHSHNSPLPHALFLSSQLAHRQPNLSLFKKDILLL